MSDPTLRYSHLFTLTLNVDPNFADVGETPYGRRRIATVKGGTFEGEDQGDFRGTEQELIDVHLGGYVQAIDAGVLSIMASFSGWNGYKHSGNPTLLTDVLRGPLGFKGFVVSDWNAHGQLPGCTNESCALAVNAGIDMLMAPDSWKPLYASTLAQARSGEIPMARVDEAVRRILVAKVKTGLFEPARPMEGRFEELASPAHRALAREAVRKSLVLLKNEGSVLPIRAGARVLVAGHADDIGQASGGWTLTWQGTGNSNADFPNGQSIWGGLSEAVRASGGTATLSASGSFTTKPDVAIVVFGEQPYAEMRGDIPTLEFQPGDKQALALTQGENAGSVPLSGPIVPSFYGTYDMSDIAPWSYDTEKATALLAEAKAAAQRNQDGRSIYAQSDAQRLAGYVVRDLGLDSKRFPPRAAHGQISLWKNELVSPEQAVARAANIFERKHADIYVEYQARLLKAGAMDFDDLLVHTAHLLEQIPEARERWQHAFDHILVADAASLLGDDRDRVRIPLDEHRARLDLVVVRHLEDRTSRDLELFELAALRVVAGELEEVLVLAVDLDEGDYLIGAALTDGKHDVMLFSDGGKAVRFDENDVRPMGRNARGVRGMMLEEGQRVIAMLVAEDEQQSVLTATENGYGKRTSIIEYTRHGRGTKGMIAIQQSERNGKVVAATLVHADDEIMLITDTGVLVRTRVAEIREMGRATQGVTLISLDEGAKLNGLQRIVENDANASGDEEEGDTSEGDVPAEDQ